MIIKLKDGRQIKLEYSFLTLQFLDEYEGGFAQLEKDYKAGKNRLKAVCYVIYALVNTSLEDSNLTYKQAVNLVNFKDIQKSVNFLFDNLKTEAEFKKKQYQPTHHRKKRK